jgi:hypothetical protein
VAYTAPQWRIAIGTAFGKLNEAKGFLEAYDNGKVSPSAGLPQDDPRYQAPMSAQQKNDLVAAFLANMHAIADGINAGF